MEQLAENLPLITNFLLYSFRELHEEVTYATLNKHKSRSIIRIILTLAMGAILINFFSNANKFNDFFANILEAFGCSVNLQQILLPVISIILSMNIATYSSSIIIKCICNHLYGDPEFYLTDARAAELAAQFTEEAGEPIEPRQLQEAVDFCRKHYHNSSNRSQVGSKPQDWKQTMENLIYHGDYGHYLNQQEALLKRNIELEKKMTTISECGDELHDYRSQHSIRIQKRLSSRQGTPEKSMSAEKMTALSFSRKPTTAEPDYPDVNTPLLRHKNTPRITPR